MEADTRVLSARLLAQVLDHARPFDEALLRDTQVSALEPRDRNFVRLLVLTTLRRLGQIDALLAAMLEKPLTGKPKVVMHCLRLGVAQLIWLKTPPHAAVNSTVDAVAALGAVPMKGLVNAVLKRAAREGDSLIARQDEAINLPVWLFDSWKQAYGEETARAILQVQLGEPPLDISVKGDAPAWAETLGGELLESGSIRLRSAGRIEDLPGYDEGAWWVQDAAAAQAVKLLGDVAGKTVIDLCAAPGGKTAQLVSQGAQVTAVDLSPSRCKRLEANMQRLKYSVTVVAQDALKWKPETPPDAILLDAPCTATGTLRRHPEAAYHRTPEDVQKLATLQKRLLARAASWLAPGGKIVYCVCSLQPEEGEYQIASFLENNPAFTAEGNSLRTHPAQLQGLGGWDGFYAICLVRLNTL